MYFRETTNVTKESPAGAFTKLLWTSLKFLHKDNNNETDPPDFFLALKNKDKLLKHVSKKKLGDKKFYMVYYQFY